MFPDALVEAHLVAGLVAGIVPFMRLCCIAELRKTVLAPLHLADVNANGLFVKALPHIKEFIQCYPTSRPVISPTVLVIDWIVPTIFVGPFADVGAQD